MEGPVTHDEAVVAVQSLASRYPRDLVTEGTIQAYAGSLERFPSRVIVSTVTSLGETYERFPSLRKVLAAFEAASAPREDSADPLAQSANPTCDLCGGTGWIDADPSEVNGCTYTTVQPCRCRLREAGGDPRPQVNREGLPGAILEALTALEFALGKPLALSSIRMVRDSLRELGADRTVEALRASLHLAETTRGGGR